MKEKRVTEKERVRVTLVTASSNISIHTVDTAKSLPKRKKRTRIRGTYKASTAESLALSTGKGTRVQDLLTLFAV